MKTLDTTAVRFFGPFNFMSPPQAGQSMCYTVLLSALRFCPPHGIRCALDMVMLNKPENLNTQNGSQPVLVKGVNFKAEVLDSKQPVLVEFWAPFCVNKLPKQLNGNEQDTGNNMKRERVIPYDRSKNS
jgi:hypothetical protein